MRRFVFLIQSDLVELGEKLRAEDLGGHASHGVRAFLEAALVPIHHEDQKSSHGEFEDLRPFPSGFVGQKFGNAQKLVDGEGERGLKDLWEQVAFGKRVQQTLLPLPKGEKVGHFLSERSFFVAFLHRKSAIGLAGVVDQRV